MFFIYCLVVTDLQINYIRTMLVDHNSYGIPDKIASLKIKALKWTDFKGTPPAHSPFSAHIYWSVSYEFGFYSEGSQPRLRVWVQVRPKSWTIKQDAKLLKHEYGHYLIGCLCALDFLKKANYELTKQQKLNYADSYRQILAECLKQYCAMERVYDEESSHNLNRQGQLQWQLKLQAMFLDFHDYFQSKKNQRKRKGAESHNRLRHQKVNRVLKVDEQRETSRYKHRQFSIKSMKRESRQPVRESRQPVREMEEQLGGLPMVLRSKMSVKCQKKVSLGSNLRWYRKMQNSTLNSCQFSDQKNSVHNRSHTTQRMLR